jgi:type VI secretion system secreted protein VgrG
MAISLSQANRPLLVSGPLDADVLVATGFTGVEEVSRPFRFVVDFVSTKSTIAASTVLGKGMTLTLPVGESDKRLINGLVSRFASMGRSGELYRYRAEVMPAFWFLTLSNDCRTFENVSALDIVEKVCTGAGVTDTKRRVTATPAAIPYVVQYRETNFAFVSRMLEAAGIYYTFDHADGKNTLVFTDAHATSIPAGVLATVTVDPVLDNGRPRDDVIFRVEREYAVHAASVTIADHDLLRADSKGDATSTDPGVRGERFDFLGDLGPNRSADEAKQRIEFAESGRDLIRGASTCPSLVAGTRIKVTDGLFGTAGADLHVLRVEHTMQLGDVIAAGGLSTGYRNEFIAMPAETPYRPQVTTERPSIRGTQTAIIVGSGDTGTVDVDEHACILLQFPWDRGDGAEGKSTHRVHVATAWAGTGWGSIHHPRLGQEVLVEYLEGDPDRPIVTGRVYNSAHKPPYALPADKSQSGTKSRSFDGGGADNFNELRFEDKKGSEHVFLQAEKDLLVNVKNDETRTVLHDRTTTIKNNDTRTVQEGNDAHTVSKGNQTVEVTEGNQTITVKQGNQVVGVSQGDQTVTVDQGKQTVTVMGDQSLTVKQGNRSATVQTGNDTLEISTGNLTITVSLGNIAIKADVGKISIEALQEIDIKCGPSSMQLAPQGITMKAVQVSIKGDAQAELAGAMVSIKGDAMTQIKGAVTQVNGDGALMLKGGVTMIN